MRILSKSLSETSLAAKKFLDSVKPKESSATIVGLYGDLGAGKTAFTKEVAKHLNISDTITSPTFVIEKIYNLNKQKFANLIHIDAHRLESGQELVKLGWKEISQNPDNLILVEWPERVEDILSDNIIKIYFTFIDDNTREIKLPNDIQ